MKHKGRKTGSRLLALLLTVAMLITAPDISTLAEPAVATATEMETSETREMEAVGTLSESGETTDSPEASDTEKGQEETTETTEKTEATGTEEIEAFGTEDLEDVKISEEAQPESEEKTDRPETSEITETEETVSEPTEIETLTEEELEEESTIKADSTSPSNPVHHCTKKDDGTDYTDWSYVYFGSYPQSEVTGDALTADITGAAYDSNGDAWVNGTKYRRSSKSDTNNTDYFGSSTYRYFKWERIKWRVLQNDGNTLFVVADRGLDCKDYHDPGGSITWENCTLREWLNNDFYGTAFSSAEQGAVVEQTVVNEDNPYYNTEGGNNTKDKVYLLSIGEVTNPSYGFCENYSTYSASRWMQTSDFAHARGAFTYSSSNTGGNANTYWWLRSPGYDTNIAATVNYDGYVNRNGNYVYYANDAVVPALHINLSSHLWSLTDDGTSGEGGNGGTGESGTSQTSTQTDNNIHIKAYEYNAAKIELNPPAVVGASVAIEGFGTASTGTDGKAVIENNLTDQPLVNTKLTVSKEGYREYIDYLDIYHKDADLLWNANDISVPMEKLREEDNGNPYISTLTCQTMYLSHCNAMRNKASYTFGEGGQTTKIRMNAVWNGKTPASYILYQKDGAVYTTEDGIFNLDMGQAFEANKPIYAKLVASDGTVTEEETEIEIRKNQTSSNKGNTIDLIDTGSSQTLGEDIPFLSGHSASMKLAGVDMKVSLDAGKVRIMVGKTSTDDFFTNEKWSEWKKFCEVQPEDLNLSQWKNVIESIDTQYTGSVTGKTEVCGYLEGTLNATGDTILSGKLKLIISLGSGIQGQYTVGVVPVYAKASFEFEGSVEGSFAYNYTQQKIDDANTDIIATLEPKLKGEGGVGVMAVATVGVEGSGSIPIKTKMSSGNEAEISLKAGMSLNVSILNFKYSKKIAEKEWKLLPAEAASSDSLKLAEIAAEDFELSDRDYLEEESVWLGDSGVMPLSLETSETNSVEKVLKTNIYPDAEMKMVTSGDTIMILWTEDDANRGAADRSELVYSIYDASSDTWSSPIAVADDGTADYAPTVTSDDSHIYVAWQNISKSFGEDASLEDVSKASTIAMSVWTQENGFSDMVTVSEAGTMAVSPGIALDDSGSPYVVYLENTAGNMLLNEGENRILYTVMENGTPKRKVFVENAGLVTALDTAYLGGYQVSYTVDGDNYLATLDDRKIVTYSVNGGSTVTDNQMLDSNAQYAQNAGKQLRFWYSGDGIYMAEENGAGSLIYQDETGALTDDFQVISGKEDELAVIWTAVDENDRKQIEGILYDGSEKRWSKSIQISDTDANVYHPSGIFTKDGNLEFLYKKTNSTETDLCVLAAEPYVDLSVENAYCDETAMILGETGKISVQVKNNGTKTVENYVLDVAGTTTTITEPVLPGEEAVIEADFSVPQELSGQSVTVTVNAAGDIDTSNNEFSLTVGYTDLAINLTDLQYDNAHAVDIKVANQSCVDTSAVLEIRKNARDGELVNTIPLAALSKGAVTTIRYLWDENTENYDSHADSLYFEVKTDCEERYTNNNYDFIAVGAQNSDSGDNTNPGDNGNTPGGGDNTNPGGDGNTPGGDNQNPGNTGTNPGENGAGDNQNPGNTGDTPGTGENGTGETSGSSESGTGENQNPENSTVVKVTKLKISAPSKKIAAGKKVQLTAKITPKNATNQNVTWKSSNKKYATVNSKGVVTTKKAGAGKTVTITVTAKDGSGRKASVKIKIMKNAVTKVKIKNAPKTLKVKKSITLKAAVSTNGKNANKTLKWTSSNSKYATVNSKGKVTAKKAGKGKTVTITAASTDGTNKKAKVKIKIK